MSNQLSAALVAIWKYAQSVEGLMDFLTQNQTRAIKIIRDLAELPFRNKPLAVWKAEAVKALKDAGIQANEQWLEWLVDLAYEVYKGEKSRSWFVRLFSRVKDFLVRNGLNDFITTVTQTAIGFVTDTIKNTPDIDVKKLFDIVFAQLKLVLPNSPGTWVSLAVNLAIMVTRARLSSPSTREHNSK